MIRLLALMRWRQLRWVACAAIVPVLWACNSRDLAKPIIAPRQVEKNRFQQSVNRDLDLLFLIDDSSSMAPLQAKMRQRVPEFMDVLTGLPGGLPNLHVAVVSSSLGAGRWDNVPGCGPGTRGNLNGDFQFGQNGTTPCTQLNAGERFLKSLANPAGGPRVQNFTGDIRTLFSCMADLGQGGCGFEHQFEATRFALERSLRMGDPNFGFFRPEAFLAVVMVTNEDDCSVPADSALFDPGQQMVDTMFGGLQSYRCNEFGHLCGDAPGTAPPHMPPGAPLTLNACRSNEAGSLTTVQGFVDFLTALKPGRPDKVLVAAIAGPVAPYIVEGKQFAIPSGAGMELQPSVRHSCTSGSAGLEYADPGIRVKQWLDAFGANAVLESICADSFAPAMTNIARAIGRALGASCVSGNIADRTDMPGVPDCEVTEVTTDSVGAKIPKDIKFCNAARDNNPCWQLQMPPAGQCPAGSRILAICYEPTCMDKPQSQTDALVSCSLMP